MIWQRLSRIFAAGGLLWSIVMFIILIFLPVYSGVKVSPSGEPPESSTATLIQVNGYWVLILLLIPVLLSLAVALPIIRNKYIWGIKRAVVWIGTAVLLIFVVLSGFSIGLFYFPASILLVVCAILAEVNTSIATRRHPAA